MPAPLRKTHAQHAGELELQRRRGSSDDQAARLQSYLQHSHIIPPSHAAFFEALPYLPLGTVDDQGRPWATLLCSPRVTQVAEDELRVAGSCPPGDPFARALSSSSSSSLSAAPPRGAPPLPPLRPSRPRN